MASFIRDGYLSMDVEGFVPVKDGEVKNCFAHLLIRNGKDDVIVQENTIPCPRKEDAESLLTLWFSGASIALPTTRV